MNSLVDIFYQQKVMNSVGMNKFDQWKISSAVGVSKRVKDGEKRQEDELSLGKKKGK